jgi:hypothetical protein
VDDPAGGTLHINGGESAVECIPSEAAGAIAVTLPATAAVRAALAIRARDHRCFALGAEDSSETAAMNTPFGVEKGEHAGDELERHARQRTALRRGLAYFMTSIPHVSHSRVELCQVIPIPMSLN